MFVADPGVVVHPVVGVTVTGLVVDTVLGEVVRENRRGREVGCVHQGVSGANQKSVSTSWSVAAIANRSTLALMMSTGCIWVGHRNQSKPWRQWRR